MKTPEDVERAKNLLEKLKGLRAELAVVEDPQSSSFKIEMYGPQPYNYSFKIEHTRGYAIPEGIEPLVRPIAAILRCFVESKIRRVLDELKKLGVDPDAKPAP